MLKRKHLILGFLAFCLTITLFIGVTSSGTSPSTTQLPEYDPWCDMNDDGRISITDIVIIALRFGAEGTPINKTALLLELQSRIDGLHETLETRVPKKGYVSVSAAAFVPKYNTYWDASNWGNKLYNDESTNMTLEFYGSVQLPNGAMVTKATSYWFDMGDMNITCRLMRYNQTHNQEMALFSSSGNAGYGSSHDDTIDYAIVHNSQYAYYLEVGIPGESNGHGLYHFQYAVIEYEHPI